MTDKKCHRQTESILRIIYTKRKSGISESIDFKEEIARRCRFEISLDILAEVVYNRKIKFMQETNPNFIRLFFELKMLEIMFDKLMTSICHHSSLF